MQNKALPLLYIDSKYKGLIKINESPAGETGTYSITTPVSPGSSVFLSFAPLENEAGFITMPFTRKLAFNGENIAITANDGMVCVCIWPDNVYELLLNPVALPIHANADVYPKVIRSFDFYIHARPYTAFIYQDTAITFAIEDTNTKRLVFAHPLKFWARTAEIATPRLSSISFLCISGKTKRDENYVVLVNVSKEFFVEVETLCLSFKFLEYALEIVTRDPGSLFDTQYIYTVQDQRLILDQKIPMFNNREQPQLTVMETIVNFIEAVRLNQQHLALEFLTPSLKEGLSFHDLKEFFGDFQCISSPLTTVSGELMDTTVALKYNLSKNIQSARMFFFDIFTARNGNRLIDNIKER